MEVLTIIVVLLFVVYSFYLNLKLTIFNKALLFIIFYFFIYSYWDLLFPFLIKTLFKVGFLPRISIWIDKERGRGDIREKVRKDYIFKEIDIKVGGKLRVIKKNVGAKGKDSFPHTLKEDSSGYGIGEYYPQLFTKSWEGEKDLNKK